MRHSRYVLALGSLFVAACHRESAKVDSAPDGSAAAPAARVPAPNAPIDACAYFSREIARAALGGEVGPAEDPEPSPQRDECGYARIDDPKQHVTVTVFRPLFTCENFAASERQEKHVEVPGIGQLAFLSPQTSALSVFWGSYVVLIFGHSHASADVLKKIASEIVPKIPQENPGACIVPDAASARCSGASTPCKSILQNNRCNEVQGCSWLHMPGKPSAECIGIASMCASMTSQTSCARQGCSWR